MDLPRSDSTGISLNSKLTAKSTPPHTGTTYNMSKVVRLVVLWRGTKGAKDRSPAARGVSFPLVAEGVPANQLATMQLRASRISARRSGVWRRRRLQVSPDTPVALLSAKRAALFAGQHYGLRLDRPVVGQCWGRRKPHTAPRRVAASTITTKIASVAKKCLAPERMGPDVLDSLPLTIGDTGRPACGNPVGLLSLRDI